MVVKTIFSHYRKSEEKMCAAFNICLFFAGRKGVLGFSVFIFLPHAEGGLENLIIMIPVPKPLPSCCFAPAFPLPRCPWLYVFERNIGTASVTEHTSTQVLLMV